MALDQKKDSKQTERICMQNKKEYFQLNIQRDDETSSGEISLKLDAANTETKFLT
jgi:hypothetical protein